MRKKQGFSWMQRAFNRHLCIMPVMVMIRLLVNSIMARHLTPTSLLLEKGSNSFSLIHPTTSDSIMVKSATNVQKKNTTK